MKMKYAWLIGLLLSALWLAACAPGAPATTAPKAKVIVGSKSFTEQLILGNMVAILLTENGYPVETKIGLASTALVHEALAKGDINVYVEYTGTGLTTILKQPPLADPDKVYETVQKGYKDQFKVVWLKPLGFNNTYTLTMRKDKASELGVSKISDLKGKSQNLVVGTTQECPTRPDCLPSVAKAYELTYKDTKSMDADLMYQAVSSKQVDIITAFSTDGRIASLGLIVLKDDKGAFLPYYAAPVVRQDLLDKSPEVADILNKLAGKIDDATMSGLNADVSDKKREPADVAKDFLKKLGLVK